MAFGSPSGACRRFLPGLWLWPQSAPFYRRSNGVLAGWERIIIRLVGLTWAVATYFVVPILAAEGTGPITALRRSVDLLKKSWGEGLTGNFVINAASLGVTMLIVAVATVVIIAAVLP